jgi:hypothetical protein
MSRFPERNPDNDENDIDSDEEFNGDEDAEIIDGEEIEQMNINDHRFDNDDDE